MAKASNKAAKAEAAKQVSSPNSTADKENKEEEAQEEVWDVVKVLLNEQGSDAMCRECNDKAVAVWASDKDPDDKWPVCESCQEKDFGGWPEGMEPTSEETKHDDGNVGANKANTNEPSATDDKEDYKPSEEQQDADDEEEEEVWDLKKIMSIAEVNHEYPIKCAHETCLLPAAVAWVSNKAPTTKWYSCLDHQVNDFGGWPDTLEELPLKHMTKEHLDALAAKCSSKPDEVEMPVFPETASLTDTHDANVTNTVTPGPNHAQVAPKLAGTALSAITPSPGNALKAANAAKGGKAKPEPNKKQLEQYAKWKETAEAMGGKGARLIVNKPEAKKLIFDTLHDAFAPMNITDLHKAVKGAIPSPVLKTCLEDMTMMGKLGEDESMFAESDDEEEKGKKKPEVVPKKKSDDPYAKSLCFKTTKNQNGTLYYVDHTKLKNNGDGLDPEARNELISEHAKTKSELTMLEASVKEMNAETTKLLSEPTNEQATSRLDAEEAEVADLKARLENARKLKGNESHKLSLKRRIEHMANNWRKRRRMTNEFLSNMEEYTEGTISAKKCLAGDGQMDIESDEIATRDAIAYYNNKKNRPVMKRVMSNKKSSESDSSSGLMPTETFVAVQLDSFGCVQRIFADEVTK